MKFLDISGDSRLAGIMEQLCALSRSADPRDVLEEFAAGADSACGYVQLSPASQGGYTLRRMRAGDSALPIDPTTFSGGFLGQLIATPVPKLVHDLQLDADPVLPREMARYRSAIAMPLFVDHAPAEWVVLLDQRADGFGGADLASLAIRTSLISATLSNLRLASELLEANLRVQREIDAIASIQQSLLPAQLPEIPGLRIAAHYEASGNAGGDLYDFVPMGEGDSAQWAILIGDVCGHGPAAAVLMAVVQSLLHAYADRPRGAGELLGILNRQLCAKRIGRSFVTAFLGCYNPANHVLTYARAGHNPPLLCFDGERQQEYLSAVGDLPLGIDPDAVFEEAPLALAPRQTLVLFTDGIVETPDGRGESFGAGGLAAAAATATPDAQRTLVAIREALYQHGKTQQPADDQTLVVLQRV